MRKSDAETTAEIISIAIAQPHRRGDDDPRRHWPVGRLILDGRVQHPDLSPGTLHRAAERYAADHARYRGALQARRPFAVTDGTPLKLDDPEMEARAYASALSAWNDVRRVLRDCGARVQQACEMTILDLALSPDFPEASLAQWIVLSLPQGLAALAKHYELH